MRSPEFGIRSIFDIEVINGEGNILSGNTKAIPLEDLFDLIGKTQGQKPLYGGTSIIYNPESGLPERFPETPTIVVSGRTVSKESLRRIMGITRGQHPMKDERVIVLESLAKQAFVSDN